MLLLRRIVIFVMPNPTRDSISQQQPATMTMANGQNGQPHRIGSMTDAIDLPRPPLKSQTTLHNLISMD